MLLTYVGATVFFFTNAKIYDAFDIKEDNGNIYEFKVVSDVGSNITVGRDDLKFWSGFDNNHLENDHVESINSPKHYTKGGIEVIDVIKAKMSAEQFGGYLWGNVIKYTLRHEEKGGVEDLGKANWYLNKLIEVLK